jgi:hypothetical protein
MPRLTTRAELARRAGVSKPAITKACKGPLRAACERDRVDLDHPLVVAYLANKKPKEAAAVAAPSAPPVAAASAPTKGPKTAARRAAVPTVVPAAPVKKASAKAPTPTLPAAPEGDEGDGNGDSGDIPEVADASREEVDKLRRALRPILARFGTRRGFRDWLVALKDLEDIRKKRLDNEETEGRLISRELVKTHVFGAIEGSHRRLLGDAPKTIARLLYSMAKTGETIEAGEQRARDVIETVLKTVRNLERGLG